MPWLLKIGYLGQRIRLVGWCLTALSAQIGYIVPRAYEIYRVVPERMLWYVQ